MGKDSKPVEVTWGVVEMVSDNQCAIRCARCGKGEVRKYPISLHDWRWTEAVFKAKHAGCKEMGATP
ncbi:MAG: hypothetical protein WC683_02920 [bacterium]